MNSLSFSCMFLILFIFADSPDKNKWITTSSTSILNIVFSTYLLGYLDNTSSVIGYIYYKLLSYYLFLKYASFQLRISLGSNRHRVLRQEGQKAPRRVKEKYRQS